MGIHDLQTARPGREMPPKGARLSGPAPEMPLPTTRVIGIEHLVDALDEEVLHNTVLQKLSAFFQLILRVWVDTTALGLRRPHSIVVLQQCR
jgi:hypothetical protein